MFRSYPMFVSDDESYLVPAETDYSFFATELLWEIETYNDDHLYEQIIFKVFRQPTVLISHIQRIYFTYQHQMKEQLYAALVDFLWVLNGKGQAVSHRMVYATHSLLSEQQFEILKQYLVAKDNNIFKGNKFNLLTSGVVGSTILVSETDEHAQENPYDVLNIARDHIEYSQLEEAKEVLEKAVLETPEKPEFQDELLELYKVTKDFQAFTALHNVLKDTSATLSTEWLNFLSHVEGMRRDE